MNSNERSLSLWQKVAAAALCLMLLLSGFVPVANFQASPAYASVFYNEKLDQELVAVLGSVSLDTPLEVVIVFSDLSAASQVAALAGTFYQMQALPMAGAVLTRSQIEDLATWPEIYSITLNSQLEYFLAESVPLVKADQVWTQYGQTGGNATVAVIDTGIDAAHPDLQLGSKVIQNVKILPFQTALEDQPITDTSSGHGTHVASTIGGTGAASDGYYKGVAPDVKLVGLGAGEVLFVLTAIQAYDWVLQHHAEYNIRVVSNSWGSTGGKINLRNPVVIATHEAYKKGILTVFAAGNDGGYDVMNPYSLAPWLLSVAAGAKDGSLADFSSRGKDGDYFKHPDITAPGVDIYAARASTVGITALDPNPNPVNPLWTVHYTKLSGTSMATPHVSGAAALLFSSKPNLSPDQVMDLLTASASPMNDLLLHEAGYGYMDVLAAFEASLNTSGSLDAFLAGDIQHPIEEVWGFDPDFPTPYDEFLYTGFTVVAATEVSPAIEHPFEVGEDALFVDIRVNWEPQVEDAYDLVVRDPLGRVVMSSGNGLEYGEGALFVPEVTGTYTLELHPFAAVAAQYEAFVKIAYGAQPEGWPPNTEPAYDYYLGVDNIFKTYGVVGIASEHFRSGDEGFIVFSLARGDGTAVTGAAANLQAVYTDRNGDIAFLDDGIVARSTAGEYQSSFFVAGDWAGEPGPITVNFRLKDGSSLRAVPTGFKLNHLETTLETGATEYQPGDEISFSGTVAQANTVGTGDLENAPVGGANVTIRLLDADGNSLASTQAVTDLEGRYSGSVVAPAATRGKTSLVAEATYEDATILLGPAGWYGKKELTLNFPGNLPPDASLYATPQTNEGKKFFVHIEAAVSDADGAADISGISLVLTDAKGRLLKRWTQADFEQSDAFTWEFQRAYKVSGSSPWTLTLTATDSAGQSVSRSVVITR